MRWAESSAEIRAFEEGTYDLQVVVGVDTILVPGLYLKGRDNEVNVAVE